ncbi:hypothetical protein NLJ89_g10038 [Agrocybe chaxingu]|uniref:Uncharacterized protein n=1 Tax=Agrocybe chaxingu TaxID=84603 RepID=A0A9W8JSF5_9AGAR|nr:hypothetical protein NLJ89_g10038 [Agrocybe chaxingu]
MDENIEILKQKRAFEENGNLASTTSNSSSRLATRRWLCSRLASPPPRAATQKAEEGRRTAQQEVKLGTKKADLLEMRLVEERERSQKAEERAVLVEKEGQLCVAELQKRLAAESENMKQERANTLRLSRIWEGEKASIDTLKAEHAKALEDALTSFNENLEQKLEQERKAFDKERKGFDKEKVQLQKKAATAAAIKELQKELQKARADYMRLEQDQNKFVADCTKLKDAWMKEKAGLEARVRELREALRKSQTTDEQEPPAPRRSERAKEKAIASASAPLAAEGSSSRRETRSSVKIKKEVF